MPAMSDAAVTAKSTQAKPPIAVIGGGYSGALAALHLCRRLPADQPVLLCDKLPGFGSGPSPGEGDPELLLNVRANNMSVFADDPGHFPAWLRGQQAAGVSETDGGLFAPRGLYGTYLQEQLAHIQAQDPDRLTLLSAEVRDIRTDNGLTLVMTDGTSLPAAGVVLALGSPPPAEDTHPRICAIAWNEKALAPLDSDRPVLIAGTGLAMTDLAVTLRKRGFTGKLIAVSPAGLLPNRHAAAAPWPTPKLTLAEATSLPLLIARLREEVAVAADEGIGWRSVLDSLRAITADTWIRMPVGERRRFLRHARRYWDALRHRMAPPHADQIDAMLEDGSLTVHAGRVIRTEPGEHEVRVTWRPRGAASGAEQTISVQRVIKAQELQPITRADDRLVRMLRDRRLIRFDAEGLGIDVSDELTVIDADGKAADRIWALGPTVRGVFWECVAVPDIRRQAANIAVSAVVKLHEAGTRR